MRKLDYNEYLMCRTLAEIFESSLTLAHFSSPMFIKHFMLSKDTNCFFNLTYLLISSNKEDIIDELNNQYKESLDKDKTIYYTNNQMYWIGYIYGALSYLYILSSKTVYRLFPAKEIVKYYNIYHTFDVEEAAERMMEDIHYVKEDYLTQGVKIFRKYILIDKLKEYLNTPINVRKTEERLGLFDYEKYALKTYLIDSIPKEPFYLIGIIDSRNDYNVKIVVTTDKNITRAMIKKALVKDESQYKLIMNK